MSSVSRWNWALLTACLAMLPPREVGGQRAALDVGVAQVLSGGEGIERRCYQPSHAKGVGSRISLPLPASRSSVALTARGFPFGQGSICFLASSPPYEGTFTFDNRNDLQGNRFLTTDLRLYIRPVPSLFLALGGGAAWHQGTDLPYVVVATGFEIPVVGPTRLTLEAEYSLLRVTTDRTRITFVEGVPVTRQSLGTTHRLSHAFTIALSGGVALF